MATKTILLFTGTSFTVPADWSDVNTVEGIGPGGNGGAGTTTSNQPGGTGAPGGYSKSINLTGLRPGATVPYVIGLGGSGTSTSFNTNFMIAKAGGNSSGTTGGTSSGVGTGNSVAIAGGAGIGANTGGAGGSGGTGAPGPTGIGHAGTANGSNPGGAGGAGSNAGSSTGGAVPSAGVGGAVHHH